MKKHFLFNKHLCALLAGVVLCGFLTQNAIAEDAKPKVAVIPLGGKAKEAERVRAAQALRLKLDRAGVYEPIDGSTMMDALADKYIDASSKPEDVKKIIADESPSVIIWGQLDDELKINILDLRDKEPKVRIITKPYAHPTDLRFAVEAVIEAMPGTKSFEHPNEEAVSKDAEAEKLWKSNPDIMVDGTFDKPGDWRAILMKDKYEPKTVARAPEVDEVVIREEGAEKYLSMNLSKTTAENNGLACLGGIIKIEPGMRYRIQFRYKSDGPRTHIFIKGYTTYKNEEREIYRRQVPPAGSTNGEWVTVVDELNPQHTTFKVDYLRVDLYAYLGAGIVSFDDIIIKAVGKPTRIAKDEAIDKPTTQP